MNRILMSDSYKYSHYKQYPVGTVSMYDYAEARSSKVYDKTVFFGLQYILKKYFSEPITINEVIEAADLAISHGIPFNYDGWMYIATELKGKIPVVIKAIPEGTVVPNSMPLFTVESTDEKVFWVASWMETSLMKVWYPCTVATRSYFVKQMLMEYAEKTQENPNVDFQFHNFGYRGSSTEEAGQIGGVAHLTQFLGTDNFYSIKTAEDFYNATRGTVGYSIPATEHSSTTAWGRDNEFGMIMKHIEDNKGAPIIAAVMDSYDYVNAVKTVTSGEFKEKIESADYPILVIRPDSGNPFNIISATIDVMEQNDVGYTTNSKGYKVWNKYRIIWGDGINDVSMREMLDVLVSHGYSSENIAFGSGGWIMQDLNRDTLGFAIKCSSITIDTGDVEHYLIDRDVFKDPVTAPNKKSKKGKISTFRNSFTGEYVVRNINQICDDFVEVLEEVYRNGEIIKDYRLDEVRSNSAEK